MFKFRTGWQHQKGFEVVTVEGSKCVVCDSTYDLGFRHPDSLFVCSRHSNCQDFVVRMIQRLRERNQKLSTEEWSACRLNSWDRDALIPYMDDELLVLSTRNTLSNCSPFQNPLGPASTYDEAIQMYASELASRLSYIHESCQVRQRDGD